MRPEETRFAAALAMLPGANPQIPPLRIGERTEPAAGWEGCDRRA
jgi:hypothetical protein